MVLPTMNTCVLPPRDKLKHRVGTAELKTGFLEGFFGFLWPRAVVIKASTLQERNYSEFVVSDKSMSFQKGKLVETSRIEAIDLGQQINARNRSSKSHSARRHLSNNKETKITQKDLTSSALRALDHPNIDTTWFLDAEIGSGYQVTFSSDITLNILSQGCRRLSTQKAECYFKELICGIHYLHSNGIAHRNICPENILVTADGVMKLTGFTYAESFRVLGGAVSKIRLSSNKCGYSSYLAPEGFVSRHFDPRPVDLWALAIVYMETRTGKLLWNLAAEGADESYDKYLQDRKGLWGYRPVENMENESCRDIIRSLLEPNPRKRPSASQIIKSSWMTGVQT